jgi:hypothetical protein
MTRWAEMLMEARELRAAADALQDKALTERCSVEDSGGARCSADALPTHAHRYEREDFPT